MRLSATVGVVLLVLAAAEPPGLSRKERSFPLRPEEREALIQANEHVQAATKLIVEGKDNEALPLLETALQNVRQALGPADPLVLQLEDGLAPIYERLARWDDARRSYSHLEETYARDYGKNHWKTVNVRVRLADLDRLSTLTEEQRKRLTEASDTFRNADELSDQGKHAEAAAAYGRAARTYKDLLGDRSRQYVDCLNLCGLLHVYEGSYDRAEPILRECEKATLALYGREHPEYATVLNNLGLFFQNTGDCTGAQASFRQACECWLKTEGEDSSGYAVSVGNQGQALYSMGNYVEAEPFYVRSLELKKKSHGEDSVSYAIGLSHLAALYDDMGDIDGAESLYRESLEIERKVRGERHPGLAVTLIKLARICYRREDYPRAESLFQQAAEIRKDAFGEEDPRYQKILRDLARVYLQRDGFARAEPLLRPAIAAARQAVANEKSPTCASHAHLGLLCATLREYGEAERHLLRALEILRNSDEQREAEVVGCLSELGWVYIARQEYAKAEACLRKALPAVLKRMELTAVIQSERQQMATMRSFRRFFDPYLMVSTNAGIRADQVYQHVLAWKGAVFARQRWLRLLREGAGANPALARVFDDLQSTASRLAALSLEAPNAPDPEARERQATELTQKKESLERELMRQSKAFRENRAGDARTPLQIQEALPKGVALVDFVEYEHSRPPDHGKGRWSHERRVVGFVVRAGQPIRQIELGPQKTIATAVARWKPMLVRNKIPDDASDPANVLRRLVWEPLEPHLKGAQTILVAPDGVLSRVAFAALPGSTLESYLIEEVMIGVIPVPRLLPELLAAQASRDGETERRPDLSALLVGDVDFGAPPGSVPAGGGSSRSAARGFRVGSLPTFPRLKATREEIDAVRDSFLGRFHDGRVRVLRDREATERTLRHQAPRFQILHLATHGFFAPAELRSALSTTPAGESPAGQRGGFHPGVLSGLALAGANCGGADRGAGAYQDDGILTALEVADLDLAGVDLTVLSACETGLGEAAAGEGLLGLQRAFQVAGARTVVATLWAVEDAAARSLMVRFYENRWQKGMPTLTALHEAQLWMLREMSSQPDLLRGLEVIDEQPQGENGRLPPFLWAAFVLSGDWR